MFTIDTDNPNEPTPRLDDLPIGAMFIDDDGDVIYKVSPSTCLGFRSNNAQEILILTQDEYPCWWEEQNDRGCAPFHGTVTLEDART